MSSRPGPRRPYPGSPAPTGVRQPPYAGRPGRDPRTPSAAAPAPGGCWAPAAQLFIAPGVTWGAVTDGRPDSQRLPHLLPKDSATAGQTKAWPAEEEEGGRGRTASDPPAFPSLHPARQDFPLQKGHRPGGPSPLSSPASCAFTEQLLCPAPLVLTSP